MKRHLAFLFILAALSFLAFPASETAAANPDYASCVACHTLPLMQAQGQMAPHGGYGPPPPGYIDDSCMMECHEWMPPEGHPAPPVNPFYWQFPLDPFSYPPGPSVAKQMCGQCHVTTLPPFDSMHPHDQIPYLPSGTTPPPSVLPLYQGDGPANQDPGLGGLVCSTCHDPHDPSYIVPSNGKPGFLRVGDPSGDTSPLCAVCHTDVGPQTIGHDLFIDSATSSVVFRRQPEFGSIEIDILVRNRGTGMYPGGWLDVQIDDGISPVMPIGGTSLPSIPPDGSFMAFVSVPDMLYFGTEVFNFVLDPSEMNPARLTIFARAPSTPEAPQNLQVMGTGPDFIDLMWDLPLLPGPVPVTYNVYRNGVQVNPWPLQEWETFFTDYGLAPDTPATYTVEAVNPEGFASPMSNRAGGMTTSSFMLRVPQDYPTIQDALFAAGPGTTIFVSPGTYSENIAVIGGQIAIRGQDANGCVLDLAGPGTLQLSGAGPNSLSGFTIRGGTVMTSPVDTIFASVFQASPPAAGINGGGFVANCIFEDAGAPSITAFPPDGMVVVANSIFMTPWPFDVPFPDEQLYLINNAFPFWPDWQWMPGENNFDYYPPWTPPGPPDRYFIDPLPPFLDGGADVGLPFMDFAPDVGIFETGQAYTARPPSNLTASPVPPTTVRLTWLPSPDEDIMWPAYNIYRSEFPDFPGADDEFPIGDTPPGVTTFDDTGGIPGTTYYYKVRAFTGVSSEASNVISAVPGGSAPTAVDDSYIVDEDDSLIVSAPGVLLNDTDPEGDPLTAVLVGGPASALSFTFMPDGSFSYTPLPDFNGTDSFTYFASDGVNDSSTATVTLTVNPVNDAPVAYDQNAVTDEDTPLAVTLAASDVENDPLSFTVTAGPGSGSLSGIAPLLIYTPNPDFYGTDSFTFTAGDGLLDSNTAIVTLTVNAVNDLRIASITMGTVKNRGRVRAIADILAVGDLAVPLGDVTVSGHWEGLTSDFDSGTTAGNGLLTVESDRLKNPTGTFTFVIDSVSRAGYVFDSAGSVLRNSIDYPPPAENRPPVTQDDHAVTSVDTPAVIDVLANDTDPDGDPLTLAGHTQPAHGNAAANPDQTITYTPDPGFLGTDGFAYTVSDGNGGSGSGAVTVTVSDAPPVQEMHVASIVMSLEYARGKTKAVAAVTLVDGEGAAVDGVTVDGDWSGAVGASGSGATDGAGTVEIRSPGVRKASGKTFTFTVTSLVKTGWIYDAGANVETSDSVTVP